MEDALVREARQREVLESLERQLALSKSASDQIRDRYAKGAETFLRVLTALQAHQRLERDARRGRRELIEYRIDLCRALGGGWGMERPEKAKVDDGRATP